jgi:hypothetical protein
MTAVDSGEILIPKPERMSVLQVGFEPSQRLNDALHRFLLPQHQQAKVLFRTQELRPLPYADSNNDGIRYHPPDASELARDARRFRQLGAQPISIIRAETGQSKRGDVQVRLELQPTDEQRRLLGGFVLQRFNDSPEEPFVVYTRFARRSLQSIEEVAKAAYMLEHALGMHTNDRLKVISPSSLYVTHPHITERSGNIHGISR